MKKGVFIIFLFVFVFHGRMQCFAGDEGGGFLYTDYGEGVSITAYKGRETTVAIPDAIDGKPVLHISRFYTYHPVQTIIIPESVAQIDANTFMKIPGLREIVVSGQNLNYSSADGVLFDKDKTIVMQYPPENTRTDYLIPETVLAIEDGAFYGCRNLINISLPPNLTRIAHRAFGGCRNVLNFNIPASVTEIGGHVFAGCSALTEICVDAENAYYSSADGVFFDRLKTRLLQYPLGKQAASYLVPDPVTVISAWSFARNRFLERVAMGDHVALVDKYAFEHSDRLREVLFSDAAREIGHAAFFDCRALKNVTLGARVGVIGDHAFKSCKALLPMSFPKTITSIGREAFLDVDTTFWMQGYINSAAHAYSIENGIPFVPYDSAPVSIENVCRDENEPVISAMFFNLTTRDITGAKAMCAIYDESGRMLKLNICEINISRSGYRDIPFVFNSLPVNPDFKIFLWEGSFPIQPLCEAF